MHSTALTLLPAQLPERLAWLPLDHEGTQQILVGGGLGAGADESPVLGVLRRAPGGDYVGALGGMAVRVRVSGSTTPRVRIVQEAGGADLASFAPDWAGQGVIEIADGARYQWSGVNADSASIRTVSGSPALRLSADVGDRPSGRAVLTGTFPHGHAAVLATLGWVMLLRERAVAPVVGFRRPVTLEEWM